jgi:hypothetical protein
VYHNSTCIQCIIFIAKHFVSFYPTSALCNIDSSVKNVSTASVDHAWFPVGVLWKEHVVAITPDACDAINDTMLKID